MGKSDNTSENTPEIPEDGDLFRREQYYMLIRCEEKRDGMKEWNEWRDANPDEKILLCGAPLKKRNLGGANLQGADLDVANLQEAYLVFTNLQGAKLRAVCLRGANLVATRLQGADLGGADLRGVQIYDTDIRGARFWNVIIDGDTSIHTDKVDRKTDFSSVGLGDVRIRRGLRQVLEYNVRRLGWREWYGKHPIAAWPIRLFWSVSDYGFSTARILLTIALLSAIYAMVYWIFPHLLRVDDGGKIQDFWHALYFSVVTITTLGFGDISANPQSTVGQFVLMSQVLLGYLLLGALITRLAVLFSADGPAMGFYEEKSTLQRIGGALKTAWGWVKRRGRSDD